MESWIDLSRTADRLLVLLADASLKGALLLLAAAGLALLLRSAPARSRHGLWCAALGAALLLPAAVPWVPAWPGVPALLTRPAASGADGSAAPGSGAPAAHGRIPHRSGSSPDHLGRPPEPAAAQPAGGTPGGDPPAAAAPLPRERVQARAGSWSGRTLAVWAAGALLVLAVRAAGLWRAGRLVRRAAPLEDAGWQRLLAAAVRRTGLARPVRLLESPAARSPMTLGTWRPAVLLPPDWRRWPRERRRIVLLHELVHVRRHDWLVRTLLGLAAALYWPCPWTWMALRRLAVEQEKACDDEVVALGARPSTYAAHLLELARAMTPRLRPPIPALEMARRSEMEGRLMSILQTRRSQRTPWTLPALALLIGLAASLAAVKPWSAAQAAPQAPDAAPGRAADLSRTLAELQRLQGELEPFEDRLAAAERELEPMARELEEIEAEMAPVEARIEGMDDELEPFEERMRAVEADMASVEDRAAGVEAELEPFEDRLAELEADMRPYEDRMEEIEEEMRPLERQLEALEDEMEPAHREMERLGEGARQLADAGDEAGAAELRESLRAMAAELQPLHRRMEEIHGQMRPLQDRMQSIHEEMRPIHRRIADLHEEMRPLFDRMREVHEEMRPHHRQMKGIHREMEPIHRRMGEIHREMEPFHERMREVHERMEPVHRRMEEIHEEMRPIHEEMGPLHRRLQEGLQREIRDLLGRELGAGVSVAALERAADRIAEASSVRVDEGRLRLLTSGPAVREILRREVGTAASQAAIEAAVQALGELEVAPAGE